MTGWYRWRDPARLTTARRAELARHDAASRPAATPPTPATAPGGSPSPQAGTACGISKTTRNRYERIRKERRFPHLAKVWRDETGQFAVYSGVATP